MVSGVGVGAGHEEGEAGQRREKQEQERAKVFHVVPPFGRCQDDPGRRISNPPQVNNLPHKNTLQQLGMVKLKFPMEVEWP
jgi:hypothetical protein